MAPLPHHHSSTVHYNGELFPSSIFPVHYFWQAVYRSVCLSFHLLNSVEYVMINNYLSVYLSTVFIICLPVLLFASLSGCPSFSYFTLPFISVVVCVSVSS